jgi:outer membrane autotransporter protein
MRFLKSCISFFVFSAIIFGLALTALSPAHAEPALTDGTFNAQPGVETVIDLRYLRTDGDPWDSDVYEIVSPPSHASNYYINVYFLRYKPDPAFAGTDSVTLRVKRHGEDRYSPPATITFNVNPVPEFMTSSIPSGKAGAYFDRMIGYRNCYNCDFTIDGELPQGLKTAPVGPPDGIPSMVSGMVLLYGEPSEVGTFNFSVTITNTSSGDALRSATRSFSLTITDPDILLADQTLQKGTLGKPYGQTFSPAEGGTSPYSYVIRSDNLSGSGLAVAGGANVSVTGTPTALGTYSFTVEATDSTIASTATATKTYSFEVVPPVAPTVQNGSVQVPYNAPTEVGFDLSTLTSGDHTGFKIAAGPASGVSRLSGNMVFYQPNPGFAGNDRLTFIALNESLESAEATLLIEVVASAPTMANATLSAGFNAAGSLDLMPLASSHVTGFQIRTTPSNGTANLSGNTVTYTPTLNHYGSDSFTVVAIGSGGESAEATITVVTAKPPVPTLADGSIAVGFNASQTLDLSTLSGSSFVESFRWDTAPLKGYASIDGSVLTYTPYSKAYGPDTFQIVAVNVSGQSAPATISVEISPPPPPVISDHSVTVPFNGSVTLEVWTLLVSGEAWDVIILDPATKGTVSKTGLSLIYQARNGEVGTDSFTFQMSSYGQVSNVATVSVVILPPEPPALSNGDLSVGYMGTNSVDLSSYLQGGPATSVIVSTPPTKGSAQITGDAATGFSLSYTAAEGSYGPDTVGLTASGLGGVSAEATFTITVGNPPAPVLVRKTFAVDWNGSLTVDLDDLTTGVVSSYVIYTYPNSSRGFGSLSGSLLTFTATTEPGLAVFEISAVGPGGSSRAEEIVFNVAWPDAPTASDGIVSIPYGTVTTIDMTEFVDGYVTNIVLPTQQTAKGVVFTSSRTSVTYIPNAKQTGADSFTYQAFNGNYSETATINITIGDPPAPEIIKPRLLNAYNYGETRTRDVSDAIRGWVDSLEIVSQPPTLGTISITGETTYTFTPNPGVYGEETFELRAVGPGGSSSGVITVDLLVFRPFPPQVPEQNLETDYNVPLVANFADKITGFVDWITASSPSNGTVSVSGLEVTYTPATNFYGSDSFSVTATGLGGDSEPSTVTVNVKRPDAPTVADATLSVPFGETRSITLATTGLVDSMEVAQQPSKGTVTLSGSVATFVPSQDAYGPDSFTVLAVGPGGTSSEATVSINISLPDAPVLTSNVALSVGFQSNASLNVKPHVTGIYDDIVVVGEPAKGTATVDGLTLKYAASAGEYGSDTVVLMARGLGGDSNTMTVNVDIATPPDPVVAPGTMSVSFNGTGSLDLTTIVSGDYKSLGISSLPSKGTASISGTQLTYTPNQDAVGADQIGIRVVSFTGVETTAMIAVEIDTPAVPPVSNDTLPVVFDGNGSIDLGNLIGGPFKSLSITSQPSKGTASLSGTILSYTPGEGAYGIDTLTFTVTGFDDQIATATLTIDIGLPPVPGVTDAALSVAFQSDASLDLKPFVTGLYDEVVMTSGPVKGTAAVDGLTLNYTASAGEYGSDSVVLRVRGPGGDSLPMTVAVEISTPSDPVLSSGTLKPAFNSSASIDLTTIVTGYYKSVSISSSPLKGTASLSGTLLTYTPNQDAVGSDEIVISVVGITGSTTTAKIAVEIETPALPPVSDETLPVVFDGNGSVDLGKLINGPFKSLSIASQPSKGAASISGSVLSYTPNAGAYGKDTLTFAVTGFDGQIATATLTIDIGLPDAPQVVTPKVALSVAFQTEASLDLRPYLTGVYDEIAIISGPAKGTAAISSSTLKYTPSAGEYGTDSLVLQATGPGGASLPMTVAVEISTPSDPVLSSGTLNPAFNSKASIDLSSLITGLYKSVSITTDPSKGTASLSGTLLTYTPNQDAVGSDLIGFTVESLTGASLSSTIAVEIVTPVLPPVSDATLPVVFDGKGSIDLGSLINGPFRSLSIASQPSKGTASLSGSTLSYIPNAGAYGTDTLTFAVTGFGGQVAIATLTIDIGLPDAPEVVSTPISTDVSGHATFDLRSLVSGVYDPASFRIVSAPSKGTFSLSGTNFTYTANAGAYGTDSFTFLVSGIGGDTSTTITINLGTAPAVEIEDQVVLLRHNETGVIDVAEGAKGGPFSGASITRKPDGGTASVSGTVITFAPEIGFQGRATLGFRLTNTHGVSADATVTFLVEDRPDVAKDREVTAIVESQAQAARQFSSDQVRNFGSRLEFLHRKGSDDREDRLVDVRMNFAQSKNESEPTTDPFASYGSASGFALSDIVNGSRKQPALPVYGKNYAIWTGGYVNFGDYNADGIDNSSTTVGVSGGVDYRFSPTFVGGIGFGYGHDSADLGDNGSENKSKAYTVALYGSYHPANGVFVDGILGYSWLDFKSRRYVTPTGDFALGNRSGHQVFGAITAGYEHRKETFLFSPYLRLEGSYANLDGFAESGAGPYDITYGDQTVSSLSGVVGARIEYEFETMVGTVRPRARVEYKHDLHGSSKTTAAYADLVGEPASIESRKSKSGNFDLGLGVNTTLNNGWDVDVEYRYGTGGGSSPHSMMGTVLFRF